MLNITKKTNKDDLILNPKSAKSFLKKFDNDKVYAYTEAVTLSSKTINKELGEMAISIFKTKNRSMSGNFSRTIYDKDKERMPGVLFYTKIDYFKIFEDGGTISSKGKGLLVPLHKSGYGPYKEKNGKKKFQEMIKFLSSSKKILWKKSKGKSIMFAKYDKDTKRILDAYRRKIQFKDKSKAVTKEEKVSKRNNNRLLKLDNNTLFPIAVLQKSIKIQKKFNYTQIISNRFPAQTLKTFQDKLSIKMKSNDNK